MNTPLGPVGCTRTPDPGVSRPLKVTVQVIVSPG
jgi:hypothetical protein